MTPPFRDDCPPEYSLFRRRFLGAGIATVGFAAAPLSLAALANTVPAMPAAKFLEVSSQLINHQLNAELGGRLGAAMAAADPAFEQKIDSILTIAKTNNAKIVEDFYPEIPPGKRQDAALAIVSAWYSGVLSEGLGSEVYAYELALMYQPTSDVMTIPSYAISGPNGWNASAPALTDMPEF